MSGERMTAIFLRGYVFVVFAFVFAPIVGMFTVVFAMLNAIMGM